MSMFVCLEDHGTCLKIFRKWHNLFDHLRVHTGERPYECPVAGCGFTFNQISNQKKHIDIHRGVGYLKCKECGQLIQRLQIVNHFENTHKKDKGAVLDSGKTKYSDCQ